MKRIALAVVVGLVLVAGFGVWWYLIRDDTPPEATLPERDPSTTNAGSDSADGQWSISEGDDTFAGFRITEHFTGGIDNTAVVHSPAVSGSMTIDGATVTEVAVEVDLTALESQDSVPPGVPGIGNRVDQMRGDGLEIDTFPTASFTLTEPIVLDDSPTLGEETTARATGDLTVHGVTQSVTIPTEARWGGEVIDVAGSLEVVLADHGMVAPERPFVSVDGTGTMEFQLVFERSR
jgi:polyisoprenoid-binding protein YceI